MYRLCSGKAPEEMIDCMKAHIPQIKGNECKEVSESVGLTAICWRSLVNFQLSRI